MPVQVIDRAYIANYDFGMCEVVVVVGQDGLVANTPSTWAMFRSLP